MTDLLLPSPTLAAASLITRHGTRPRPALPFLGTLRLDRARVHEFCGPARRTLALMAARGEAGGGEAGRGEAGRGGAPVLWISPGWLPDRLNPDGVSSLIAPGRLIFVQVKRAEDLLWSMEEALRSGAAPLVVLDLPEPPGLTPVRRLHLAAEQGAETGPCPPLGLILTPGDGGAPGVETRWHLRPAHAEDRTLWHLDRRRARMEPPRNWQVRLDAGGLRLAAHRPPPDQSPSAPE